MKSLVEVKGLVVEARAPSGHRVQVLDGVSLVIAPGEVVGLIGASGSGKSTLGLALSGYARPGARIVSGQVLFEGRCILDLMPRELRLLRGREVAFVPQSAAAAFNPSRTINRQVTETTVSRASADRADATRLAQGLYRDLGLPEPDRIGQRYPHQLSGGQLQRAAAAMAFAGGPKLIVFDEPTTALDVTTQVGVLAAFRDRTRASRIAAVYISHDLAVVAQIADRIVVMEHGRVIDEGLCAAVIARHAPAKPPVPTAATTRSSVDRAEPLVVARDLSFRYPRSKEHAVSAVDLAIRRAEVVGLIGESGSGKTTLARIVAGLLRPAGGEVRLLGQPLPALVSQRSEQARRAIQIVFQSADVALNPRHTIKDILGRPLSFLRGLKGEKRAEEILRLLALVELPEDMANRFPGQLSGGQKQRVNLARALAAKPDLVICDEVTSALDAPLRERIVNLLRRLREQEDLAMLFVTHDLSTAADFADRIVVMHKGCVVEEGPTAKVLTNPLHPYTEMLVRSIPQPDAGWLDAALTGRRAEEGHGTEGCGFWSRCTRNIAGLCDRNPPRLTMVESGHRAACHAIAPRSTVSGEAADRVRQSPAL